MNIKRLNKILMQKGDKDILRQFKKVVPLWSAFTSLLSNIAVIGACVLLSVIHLTIFFKLILTSM